MLVAAAAASTAQASPSLRAGLYDNAQILYGNPDRVFPLLREMNTKLLRADLWWGGPNGVARTRPQNPTDPADPAYKWDTYDRTALYAKRFGVEAIFSIIGTPNWANRGKGWNVAPTDAADLQAFAQAAARRYNGKGRLPNGQRIPRVKLWMVWNEPNNPVFLKPQWERVGGTSQIRSARDYAAMCNAVVAGIRRGQGGTKIACGVTGPRGNNNPNTFRASVSPLAFLEAMKKAGARGFNAIAHHPYYGKRSETPDTPPPQGKRGQPPTAVTLGNFDLLVAAIDRLYGKRMRIWVTEYGYQTNPPDRLFGVTQSQQAEYMQQAWEILLDHPRVDIFIWFLLQDEPRIEGWQSGLYTVKGKRKIAREVFEQLGAP
jgi:hypothetical protein